MPRVTETLLDSGDRFPHLVFHKVGGGTVCLPDDLVGAWGVVLLYRDHCDRTVRNSSRPLPERAGLRTKAHGATYTRNTAAMPYVYDMRASASRRSARAR